MRFSAGRAYMFRISQGKEIVSEIKKFVMKNGIYAGIVMGIGSLKNPKIGYFEVSQNKYMEIELNGTYELVSLMGNISIKEDEVFTHIHAALGDRNGMIRGGHLIQGEVFVAEIFIQELVGNKIERKKRDSGLYLWDSWKSEID